MSNDKVMPQIDIGQNTNAATRARYTAYLQCLTKSKMRNEDSAGHTRIKNTGERAL